MKLLHPWSWAWLIAALLYGWGAAFASEPAASALTPAAHAGEPPLPYAHVALLLPANSPALGRAAEAVSGGFLAAAKIQGGNVLPVRLYPLTDDPQATVAAYREALAAGARVAVGPLTRNAVAAIAVSRAVAIPTLALNVPEGLGPLPANLYSLSLHAEGEARQVARLAAREGRAYAVTVVADLPHSRRIQRAFVEEFIRSGGRHVAEQAFTTDLVQLSGMRQSVGKSGADMAFLALDFPRARVVRPYLGSLPLYATSYIHPGAGGALANFDLAQVRFLDMPWMLQPDHPAVMVYPRPDFQGNQELDRLYALGVDAFRIVQGLLEGRQEALDGVTGRLAPGEDRYYVRGLTRAQFVDGRLILSADAP
jgi:outer membrane PBP1 activator LpoA protein